MPIIRQRQALVKEPDRRWHGHEACDEPPVIIQAIDLISPPSAWAPSLRIQFTLGGRHGVWEDEFDIGYLIDDGPVSSAADWFARIAWTSFLEMQDVGSQPRGLQMLEP